jgi:DNA excision repair protein ERCC-2
MTTPIKLGIRQLVEFACRSGDLGYDGGPAVSALQGIQTHQKIQKRYHKQALAEQAVKLQIQIDEYDIELGGRVDLLFADETPARVEEIKTVYSFMNDFSDDYDEPHWAQAKCYAVCYALEHQLDEIVVSLNYVNLFNQQEHRQTRSFQRTELESFLQAVLRCYIDWYHLVSQHRDELVNSANTLAFPFEDFRAQQHRFAASVYRCIRQSQRLLAEAPTGSGKTISTLFPSVKAIGEDIADQIIYLSAKTSGQNEALKAIEAMIDKGLLANYLIVQAKAKACACVHDETEIDENGKCHRTLGFYDRLPAAREALFRTGKLTSETIKTIADQHCLCPFELSLQMLPWIDIVVCDLNYIFDPLVQLSYFKTDRKRKVLLIDEMHNLVDRARQMYSASLSRSHIKLATKSGNSTTVTRAIKSIGNALDLATRQNSDEETVSNEVPAELTRAISRFSEKLGTDLFGNKHISAQTLEFAKALFRFQCIANLYGDHHRTIAIQPVRQREMRLLCLNAFEYLNQIYPLFHAVCGFSATLSPTGYFHRALGLDEKCQLLQLESSFPPDNLQVNICSYVDTRYRQRDQYIPQICTTIERCYTAKSGNYLVFFSSYAFMQKVHDYFTAHYSQVDTMLQTRAANEQQRTEFLNHYFERNNTLGFAIMGGIFAEGIDYVGSALIGTIIVGVGMPQANTEQQLIQQDFDAMQLNGFDFAYRFPGLTRVQQSAGRVIRSETDRGIVVLLDNRFRQAGYQAHLPTHWQVQDCADVDTLEQSLVEFWEQPDGDN